MKRTKLTWWQRKRLTKQLKQTRDVRVYQRSLAILEYDRGQPITHIARTLDVSRFSVYRWVAAFTAGFNPAALHDASRSGRPARWTDQTTRWLEALLASSPQDWGYQAVNWTMPLLGKALVTCTGQTYSRSTIWRELRRLNYVWKRPRYVLRPDPEREKKTPDSWEIAPTRRPQRGPGPGRDRRVAVSAATRGVEPAR